VGENVKDIKWQHTNVKNVYGRCAIKRRSVKIMRGCSELISSSPRLFNSLK